MAQPVEIEWAGVKLHVESEWEGGKPVGCVEPIRLTSYRFRVGTVHIASVRVSDHAGDRDAARVACEAIQYKYSKDNNLLKNEWRKVIHVATGKPCLQVRLDGAGGDHTMICDRDNLDDVVAYTWGAMKGSDTLFYARRTRWKSERHEDGKRNGELFHRRVTQFKFDTVDHDNGNALDNRKANLLDSTPALNQLNRMIQKNNKSGNTGVRPYDRGFTTQYNPSPGRRKTVSFPFSWYGERAEEMAIALRQAKEKELNIKIRARPGSTKRVLTVDDTSTPEEPPKKKQKTVVGYYAK